MEPGAPSDAIRHDRGVVVDDHGVGDPAEAAEAPHASVQEVGHGLGVAVHDGVAGGVGKRGHPAVALPGGAVAHGDPRVFRLPPVAVGDLAGEVGGPLVAPRGEERRTDGGEVVLQDRDAAGVPVGSEVVEDDRGRDLGVRVEHRRDGVLVPVELRAGRLPGVPRRLDELEQPDHRGTTHAEPSGDRRLAQVLPFVEAMDLRPVVHVVHPFLLPSMNDGRFGRELLPVWEVSSLRPARGVNSSGGVDILSERLRHRGSSRRSSVPCCCPPCPHQRSYGQKREPEGDLRRSTRGVVAPRVLDLIQVTARSHASG